MEKNKKTKKTSPIKPIKQTKQSLSQLIHEAREKMRADIDLEEERFESFAMGFRRGFLRAFDILLEKKK